MKGNALKRFFAMLMALAMLTTPILAVAEEANAASEPVVEAEALEPMVEETGEITLGGDEEVAAETEAVVTEAVTEEISAPTEAETGYADEDYPADEYEINLTKTSDKKTIAMGDTLTVYLDMGDLYATQAWTSSKTKVATVEEYDESGCVIVAHAAGSAKIKTKLSNRKSVTLTVTVVDPYIATGVTADELDFDFLKVGETCDLSQYIFPEPEWADPSTLTWKSSSSSKASVSKAGVVTAKKAGTVTITATTKKKPKEKASFTIVVKDNKVTGMSTKPTKTMISALTDNEGWTFIPLSLEMKSNGDLATQFYLLNGTNQKTKSLQNMYIYLAGDDMEPFAVYNFGTVKVSCSKNSYKSFKLNFPSKYVDQSVFMPEFETIYIGFVDGMDDVYAIPSSKNADDLEFIPIDDLHIGEYEPTPPDPVVVKVASVTVTPATASVEVGKTTSLKADVLPTNATNKTVTWKSSNEAIATVSAAGVVTGKAAGQATITATAADGSGKSGACTVTVTAAPVEGFTVAMEKTALSLEKDKEETLKYTVTPASTTATAKWSSTDETIAKVDQTGKVTAIKEGKATITVEVTDKNITKSATCEVTVTAAVVKVTKVTLDKTSATLEAGNELKLTATVEPANATDSKVTWTSSDDSIATVSEGTVKAVKAGKATITATAGDVKAECAIEVTPVNSIHLDKEAVEVIVGENVRLYVKEDKTVTWTTPNSDIISVTDKGIVTAKKIGKAKVIATLGTDSATCEVTVVGANVTDFDALTAPPAPFYVGDTHKLVLTNIQPAADANINSITWSSSNEAVATVTANDKGAEIKAVKAGTATITATLKNGTKKTVTATVVNKPVYPKTIVLSANAMTIEKGKTDVLAVKEYIAEDPTQTVDQMGVKYTSSNTTVATVDETSGTVSALEIGTATIFVESVNGSATASCTVNVVNPTVTKAVNSIAFDDSKDYSTTVNAQKPLDLSKNIVFDPTDATNKGITWTSSNQAIATVDENGIVTGKAVGTATITAKSKDNPNAAPATHTVTVNPETFAVTGVTVSLKKAKDTDPDYIDLSLGNTVTLEATIEPANATNKKLIWKSDKPEIATVADGVVTGVSVGKAIITVLAEDGKTKEEEMKKATIEVTVKNIIHVDTVELNMDELELDKGKSEILSVTITGVGGKTPDETGVIWKSTDPSVASVESGRVTAIKAGTTTVTATSKETDAKFAKCVVTVKDPATGITLDQTGTVDLVVGKSLTLKATVEPATTTDKVEFTSDKADIATVSSTGVVTGKAIGKAVITAKAGSKTATVTINVVRAPMAKVTGVKTILNDDRSVNVEWAAESTGYGDHYWVFCKQGDTVIDKIQTTGTTATISADKLKSNQVYQITVQATHGQDPAHLTGNDEYEEGPVSDAVSLNY